MSEKIDWKSMGALLATEDTKTQGDLFNTFLDELREKCKISSNAELLLNAVRRKLNSNNIELLKGLTMEEK